MSSTPETGLPRTAEIVVVGGGVVGASLAYHLAERGATGVVVLERDAIGAGTTSKAAGGIRAQFGTETEIRFSLEALDFFKRFKAEFGVDAEFRQIGYLTLIADEADLAAYERRVALQRGFGVDVRVIAPAEAAEIVRGLVVEDLLAAVYCPTDGYAGPYEVTMGLVARARERGARFIEGVEVTGIALDGDRVAAVATTRGRIATPVVVNAAGPAAARIGRMVGVELPVLPRRRHIFVTEDFPELPGPIPLTTDRGSGLYFRKELKRLLISPGDAEDIGSDSAAPVDWRKLEDVVEKVARRIPLLEAARVTNAWAGLRPLTPDEHAILGALPGVRGGYVAAGFCGHGFQHAPPAGRHLAELILDGRSSLDLSLFDPARMATR